MVLTVAEAACSESSACSRLAKLFVGGPVGEACGRYAELVLAVTTLAFGFWFLRFLYQRKIFLRV